MQFGGTDALYDLDDTGIVDNGDLTEWLSVASDADPVGRTFIRGDANLDRIVGGGDFTAVVSNFGIRRRVGPG